MLSSRGRPCFAWPPTRASEVADPFRKAQGLYHRSVGLIRPGSTGDLAAALLRDDEHRGPGRHAVREVGPARGWILKGCRSALFGLARMLDRKEQRLVIGREERPTQLGA